MARKSPAEGDLVTSSIEALLIRTLPPTIHPMVVHFPIALAYLLILVEGIAILSKDRWWERAGFGLLTLEIFALLAAMVAGIVSSSAITLNPTTAPLLAAHKRDAVLTGLAFGALWIWRSGLLFPGGSTSSRGVAGLIARRRRPGLLSFALLLLGVAMVSITGSLGGNMVYNHGLGVHALAKPPAITLQVPSASHPG